MHIPLCYSIFSLFLRCVSLHQNLKIMNKKIIIPALIAVTLTACGGGNTQNNGGSDNSHTATQTTAQTTEAAKPAALKPKYVIADRLGGKFIFEDENIPSNAKRKVPAQTPDSLKNFKYIINDGKYYPVKLVGYQVGSEEGDNGRDMWHNFNNMAGWVYEMESGRLREKPEDEYDAGIPTEDELRNAETDFFDEPEEEPKGPSPIMEKVSAPEEEERDDADPTFDDDTLGISVDKSLLMDDDEFDHRYKVDMITTIAEHDARAETYRDKMEKLASVSFTPIKKEDEDDA